jgi:hypothetical protein
MAKARIAILLMLFFCSAVSVFWGFAVEGAGRGIIVDFKFVYLDTRCLLENRDPYDGDQMMSVYLEEGGTLPSNRTEQDRVRQAIALMVYFPSAFPVVAPFAMLPFGAAHVLWSGLTVFVITLAAFLMWILAQDRAPNAAFYLACFVLANSGILFAGGNPAGFAIGLCLVAVWCFLKEKHTYLAICCFAVSLALKPHDTGLVWLYFLLAGGLLRRRALQTFAMVVVLGLPAILWVTHVSPHWMNELSANLSSAAAPGGVNDPGPTSMSGTGGGMVIDLQTVVSLFRNDPAFYNPITYVIFGLLLLVWIIVVLRSSRTAPNHYLALAAIAALSMLPVYHRPHDAKLLLLTLPACAALASQAGAIGRIAVVLNSAAIVLTSDLPLGMLALLTKDLNGTWKTLLFGRPMPLILLSLGGFYLWAYARQSLRPSIPVPPEADPCSSL